MANDADDTKDIRLSVRLSESLDFLLARESRRQRCSKSDVARKAIEAYLYKDSVLTRAALLSKLSQLQEEVSQMPEEAFKPEPKGRSRR